MKYDAVIIGGGPAGMVTAATVKKFYPEKSVVIVKKEEVSMIPCGIPYILATLGSVEADIMPTKSVENLGVQFIIDEVVDVDKNRKIVKVSSGEEIEYEKLVFATGSQPIFLNIEGSNLEGVYVVSKSFEYLKKLYDVVKEAENIVIVGGGFIGVEVSDELRKLGKNVTIVEMMDHLLPTAFDKEFGEIVKKELEANGIKIYLNSTVKKILGKNRVEGVELADGGKIEADLVIFSVGYKPNSELAKKAGIRVGTSGGIWVDEYMRTSEPDIFAVGDCVEHKDFFTRKPTKLMLASAACFEARIAGTNLFNLGVIRKNKGDIGIFSTHAGNITLAAAGITEEVAIKEGFEIVVGRAKGFDRHPSKIPDASSIEVKLIFSKDGVIIGGQIIGGKSVGEMINIVGLAIQEGLTVAELCLMQIGTHPLLTSPPTAYPIIAAAEDAWRKISK
ncbi:MAG: FAD-dependent oxidoreductase [Candidatus Asgardarchaeia archaeon]